MSAAAQRAARRAAFGTSSDDDSDADTPAAADVERHSVVRGLSVLRGFLSCDAQAALLAALRAHGWAPPPEAAAGGARNQAMHFGYESLPPFARELADAVAAAARAHALLPPALSGRAPPFNQLISNSYAPGARAPPRAKHAAGVGGNAAH